MTSEEIDCLRAKMKCLWKNSKRDFSSNKVVTRTFTEEERNMLDYIVEKTGVTMKEVYVYLIRKKLEFE